MATNPERLDFKAEIADAFRRSGATLKTVYGPLAHLCYVRGLDAPLPMSVSQWVNGKYEPTGQNAFILVEVLNDLLKAAGQRPMTWTVNYGPPDGPTPAKPKPRSRKPKSPDSRKRGTKFLYPQDAPDQVKRAA